MTLKRISTGVVGLDKILSGGLIIEQSYLIKGQPGSGKTTLGFHFLDEGKTEAGLFISFSEPEARLRRNAKLMQMDLDGVEFLDLSPTADFFIEDLTYDIFTPEEVDKTPTTKSIIDTIDRIKPQRVFLDGILQFRYFARDSFQFRKQMQSFIDFMRDRQITFLFTSEESQRYPDDDLQFMSDSVIKLKTSHKRQIEVSKYRSSGFMAGNHDLILNDRGMQVFPSLIPDGRKRDFLFESISAGIFEIDELLHGGIERGTVTIVSGPSGVGKSTFCIQFMNEAAKRGERSVLYTFEESEETIIKRCEAINIPVREMLEDGTLSVVAIEPLKYTSNQFIHYVCQEVEQNQAKIITIDSTSGYQLSMQEGNLIRQLHSMCHYLTDRGVTVILINETHTVTGGKFSVTEVGLSYLADNLIFLRYLELRGELRKAIGVLKKRTSNFERTLREFQITKDGIKVGKPLTKLRGILNGVPTWVDEDK